LDPYDGFFDQALDAKREGDLLCFVLDDVGRDLARKLGQASVILGTFMRSGWRTQVAIEQRISFADYLEGATAGLRDESSAQVRAASASWRDPYGGRLLARFGLPSCNAVEQAATGGEANYRRGVRDVVVRPAANGEGCIAILLGSNDINSCQLFRIADADRYREAVVAAAESAEDIEQVEYWSTLLPE
jgi:hypothetical protein